MSCCFLTLAEFQRKNLALAMPIPTVSFQCLQVVLTQIGAEGILLGLVVCTACAGAKVLSILALFLKRSEWILAPSH
jgi:hypothetical protein